MTEHLYYNNFLEGIISALGKIAFFQNRRDEVPNQLLAKELADKEDRKGIQDIAENLTNKDRNISSDCLKVLYEIGYLKPDLIGPYGIKFLDLLKHEDNRKVWGAMIALASIAEIAHGQIAARIDDILAAFHSGSLITHVWGVRVLSKIAAHESHLEPRILPEILQTLRICLPRDIPTHLESMIPMINSSNLDKVLAVVKSRQSSMTPAQLARLKKVLKMVSG
jgi:hypothetical protein